MQEDFIHYLWQYQQFDTSNLKCEDQKPIVILKTGLKNHNQGPDFSNAHILIEGIEWVGQVEIHIKSKDWDIHKHQNDEAYDNVILHVVWDFNGDVFRKDSTKIPTLVLKNRVNIEVLEKYKFLLENPSEIACSSQLANINSIYKMAMIDQAMLRRLESKSNVCIDILEHTKGDWEETCYQLFLKNLGFKLNAEAFLRLAQNLPFKIIKKHQKNIFQIETLIYGVAGFLENNPSEYGVKLKQEFDFLCQKYQLTQMRRSEWKFAKTRLANFPTVRLSQLAAILNTNANLFEFFLENFDSTKINKMLSVLPSEYWQTHYDFDKVSAINLKGMGKMSIENILINTQVNLLAAYGIATDQPSFKESAIGILENLKPEKNNITAKWQNFNIQSAFDSQALIEQYNNFCAKKQCVHCAIGTQLLKS